MSTSAATTYPRLVGDVGGTNARFAWLARPGEALTRVQKLPAADFPSLTDAIRHYLAQHGGETPRWCAIGIANPVIGDLVQMTNRHWSFSISQMQRDLGLDRLLVINDFTALALSLAALQPSDLRQVGGGIAVPDGPQALLGPGTGLGVSGVLRGVRNQAGIAIKGEGGHVTLAAADERDERIIDWLRRRFGHASAERALSGPGIENLHRAVCEIAGEVAPEYAAPQISELALNGSDPRCVEAIDLFFGFLGNVSGNLALTLGALGGLYIGGGIVPLLGTRIDTSRFRECFESKGRFRAYLQAIPVFVLQPKFSPALIGAARALDEV